MKWIIVYNKIIEKAKSENRKKSNGVYYEAHHILPSSLGGLGTRKQWRNHPNIILLTAREHFFCHQLLTKIYPGKEMNYALWYLSNLKQIKNTREYEKLRLIFVEENKKKKSILMKNLWSSNEFRNKMSSKFKNRWTENAKKEQSLKLSGKKRTQEQKETYKKAFKRDSLKRSERAKGFKSYTNGVKVIKSKNGCPEGFYPGVLCGTMSNRTCFTNGIINKFAFECPEGFWKGKTLTLNQQKSYKKNKKFWFTNGEISLLREKCPDGFYPGRTKILKSV